MRLKDKNNLKSFPSVYKVLSRICRKYNIYNNIIEFITSSFHLKIIQFDLYNQFSPYNSEKFFINSILNYLIHKYINNLLLVISSFVMFYKSLVWFSSNECHPTI